MYLIDIKENQEFSKIVFVISSIEKTTKNGKKYITGDVRDKTGIFKYNLWDISSPAVSIPKQNSYYKFVGIMEKYQNTFQINLKNCEPIDIAEVDEKDFKKSSEIDLDKVWNDLEKLINSFTDEFIIFLANEIFIKNKNFIKKYKTSPAAETVHGAWLGGLLEHSFSVAKLGDFVVNYYNNIYFDGKINRDIVVFGSLVHDIGKIWEYDYYSPAIKTTKIGELLGHVYLSTNKIYEIAKKYKEENKNIDIDDKLFKLLHVILAHHGKLEFGAPIVPKIPEAIIIHHIDNIDAKLITFLDSVKNLKDEITPQRNFFLENARLYNIFFDTKNK